MAHRRAKIVCTLGPASNTPAVIRALIRAGMNVARLNFSHGSHEQHAETIRRVRAAAGECGCDVAILQDLSGPKIRTGEMAAPAVLVPGRRLTLTADSVAGSSELVTLPHPELFRQVRKGMTIYLDDARLQLKVTDAREDVIETKVVIGGELGAHKGVTIPGTRPDGPGVTAKDLDDLRFGLRMGVDWAASSFVCDPSDVEPLRRVMAEEGRSVPIIAKVERAEALHNIDGIIEVYDGIMVARGDLGIELPIEEVPVAQKQIIRKCNLAGKPVITATQMLDSMMRNPRPTRAEATDVANAIFDGTDATMLSGETAVGQFPVQAVQTMDRIARRAERNLDYKGILRERVETRTGSVTEAIGQAAAELAEDLRVPAIITCTATGTTARLVAKYRPRARIIAAASRPETARQLALTWGVIPLPVPAAERTDEMIDNAVGAARECGYARKGDTVVVIAGVPVGIPGSTSLIRVLAV